MKKHLTALRVWGRAHKPFLKVVTLVIVVGLAVNLAVFIYGSVMVSRILARNALRDLEREANDKLVNMLMSHQSNPRVVEENIVEGIHFRMEKISDAGSPSDTWHMVGWRKTNDGENYRLEGCFAAPPASDNQSN